MIPLKTPWIVAFGDPLGVDQIGANPLLNRDPMIAVSMPSDAGGFPDSVLGYDGVDMMLIGGSSTRQTTFTQRETTTGDRRLDHRWRTRFLDPWRIGSGVIAGRAMAACTATDR